MEVPFLLALLKGTLARIKSAAAWLWHHPMWAAAIAAVIFAAWFYWHNTAQNNTIAKQGKAIEKLESKLEGQAAVIAEKDGERKRAVDHAIIKEQIDHAPQSDGGPVAPVILHAIDSLRDNHAGH